MSEQTASRTLVKSPPELWAALSDPDSLAQHLGEFGEIRITRLEAESTVAWEGDRARGTIELAPTAWGTRVTLTAVPAQASSPPPVVEPATAFEHEPERAPPPPVAPPAPPAAPAPVRGGLFGRVRRALSGSQRSAAPPAPRDPPAPAPPTPPAPRDPPAPAPPAPPAVASSSSPAPPPERPCAVAPERALAVLTGALDALGAAHHRPFSRD